MFLKVILQEAVTVIRENDFKEWKQLEEVILPSNLKKIEKGAFLGCTSLRELHIPRTVEVIEEEAFKGCHNLTIYLSNGNIQIDNRGFEDCLEVILQSTDMA